MSSANPASKSPLRSHSFIFKRSSGNLTTTAAKLPATIQSLRWICWRVHLRRGTTHALSCWKGTLVTHPLLRTYFSRCCRTHFRGGTLCCRRQLTLIAHRLRRCDRGRQLLSRGCTQHGSESQQRSGSRFNAFHNFPPMLKRIDVSQLEVPPLNLRVLEWLAT